jgi:excisionase family DNA binding protein
MEHHAMSTLRLSEAAEQVGVSKSTLFRAVRAGRLSATRTDDGLFLIDAAELFRVYPAKGQAGAETRVAEHAVVHHATVDQMVEIRVRNADLEAQVKALREMLDEARKHGDAWREQAQRLALAAPKPADTPARRGWWPWRRSA